MSPGQVDEEGSAPRLIYDVGLQPERTALAWRRTALSLLIASLGAARLLAVQLGPAAVALGVVGALWAVILHHLAGRRAGRSTARLLDTGDLAHRHHGGRLLAGTALVTFVLGLAGAALLLLHRLS